MKIIIDGYNLLRHIYPKINGQLDKQRTDLLKQLSFYKSAKREQIQEIIVVFDGGLVRHATREIKGGIIVIFAGQKISADDWIIDYVHDHKQNDLLVITSDQEIVSASAKDQVQTLGVYKFYTIIKEFLMEQVQKESHQNFESTLKKYENICEEEAHHYTNQALDFLMEEASRTTPIKNESDASYNTRKSQAMKLSKKKKLLYNKLKKLH